MTKEFEFDVFLSRNSEDKPLVELIAKRLKAEFGLNPFLDKWSLISGKTWPNELERALDQSATSAVFLGAGDKGPWHDQEMQRALVKAAKTHEQYRIVPVLLPGSDDSQVSGFLGLRTWFDFRGCIDDDLYKGARLELAEQWEQATRKHSLDWSRHFWMPAGRGDPRSRSYWNVINGKRRGSGRRTFSWLKSWRRKNACEPKRPMHGVKRKRRPSSG